MSAHNKGGGKNGRTKTMTIRVQPALYEAAQKVSGVTNQTVSSLTEYALRRYIEKNFPEAFRDGAKVIIKWDDAPGEGGQS